MSLHLVSHALCPYVQRVAISLVEKAVPFERTTIDLAAKPRWFLDISPLGKTPVLLVDGQVLFESAAILEFLEDTEAPPLHPATPVVRAQHRGWIEVGSSILNDISGLYTASDAVAFETKVAVLSDKFARLERALGEGPFFAGAAFSLVDAVFGPIFRYFDTFDQIADFGILRDLPRLQAWRSALAARPSVRAAVAETYPDLLSAFLLERKSHLSRMMTDSPGRPGDRVRPGIATTRGSASPA